MREIILDTETTGLDPFQGDRIVEIAAIEVINGSKSNNYFHRYINPERDIPQSAFKVHGISSEFVADKPRFIQIVDDFLVFVASDPIVAHNAEFDLRFINSELKRAVRPELASDRVIDTLSLARKKHPGCSNSLDALCDRYGISRARRIRHGALIDAEILADIYVELTGGRQTSLALTIRKAARQLPEVKVTARRSYPLHSALTGDDVGNHRVLVNNLSSGAIWRRYFPEEAS